MNPLAPKFFSSLHRCLVLRSRITRLIRPLLIGFSITGLQQTSGRVERRGRWSSWQAIVCFVLPLFGFALQGQDKAVPVANTSGCLNDKCTLNSEDAIAAEMPQQTTSLKLISLEKEDSYSLLLYCRINRNVTKD